nr:MAG TPA: Protein of unknown function (DUF1217) [Caudoviricetes sp.]DAV96421.1 MAG TPA: Protein of unknown function (DUF1217) [Caudoviricetes sp.]
MIRMISALRSFALTAFHLPSSLSDRNIKSK